MVKSICVTSKLLLLTFAIFGAVYLVYVTGVSYVEEKRGIRIAHAIWDFIMSWGAEHGTRPYPVVCASNAVNASRTREFIECLTNEEGNNRTCDFAPYEQSSTGYLNWLTSSEVNKHSDYQFEQDFFRRRILFNRPQTKNAVISRNSNPWCVVAGPLGSNWVTASTPILFTKNINLTTMQLRNHQPASVHVRLSEELRVAMILTGGGDVKVYRNDVDIPIHEFSINTNYGNSIEVWGGDGVRW